MLDKSAFHSVLHETLRGVDATSAIELHLHGGESFFLSHVKRLAETFAVCELVPMHEWSAGSMDPRRVVRPQEAAVPYTTIAELVVSARRIAQGAPIGFRGANGLADAVSAGES